MNLTQRELAGLLHGIVFGALYLLAFSGGLAGLYSLRPQLVTAEGVTERVRRLRLGMVVMAVLVWLTVIVGTYVVYPDYRAAPPAGIDTSAQSVSLERYPRYWLLASEDTADWHRFGMEWKEHVAWIAPILATVVAYAVLRYGDVLVRYDQARYVIMVLFFLSFAIAGIAGLLGALITKVAPIT